MKPIRAKKVAGWLAVAILASLASIGCEKAAQKPADKGGPRPSATPADTVAPRPDRAASDEPAAPAKPAVPTESAAPTEPAVPTEPVAPVASPPAEGSASTEKEPSVQEPPVKGAPEAPSPDTPKPAATATEGAEEQQEAKPRDLGPPLVDDPKGLKQLDPAFPAWIDPVHRQVVMVGEVCQRQAPLEMFACLKNTKEHEAVVSIETKAANIHAGLLAIGAEAGHPVQFLPKYVPAEGTEIEVTVRWKDPEGKVQTARAQDWVRDYDTKKPMEHPWVFGGSGFWTDERTGERHYQAQSGDFICVSNFPSAMLDLPIPSTDKDGSLLFEAFTERIPPLGTPVTLILTPKLDKKPEAEGKNIEKAAAPNP